MIIAGYEASSMSGATPVTLVTTLTHVMLGDERIATFQTQTDDTPKTIDDDKLIYHIADHLNSSSLDLSATWLVLQATDYLPFWQSNTYEVTTKRVKGKKWWYTNKYQFSNKQLDEESDLQYFEKRYYDNRIGRFTTEDPVYWEVGLTKRPNQYFPDPQQWNSYSYVRNNPINLVDPTGEAAETAWDILNVAYDVLVVSKNSVEVIANGVTNIYASATWNQELAQSSYQAQLQNYSELWNALIDTAADTLSAAIPFVPAGGTKVVRAVGGTKVWSVIIKTTEDLFSNSSKMKNVSAGWQRSITWDANKIFNDLAKNYKWQIKTEANWTKYFQTENIRVNVRNNSTSWPTLDVKDLSTNKSIKYRVNNATSN
jgi:RHS repeat-associated protein